MVQTGFFHPERLPNEVESKMPDKMTIHQFVNQIPKNDSPNVIRDMIDAENHQAVTLTINNAAVAVTRSIIRIWDGGELIETFFHHANRFFPKKIVFAGGVYEPVGHESHDYQLAKA